jgi:hypothetical protein
MLAREALFFVVPVLLLLAMGFVAPIPQSQHYHAFADARELFGVPNFVNVVTSLAFVLVSVPALLHALSSRAGPGWTVFFAATAMVGLGSAYYHLAPQDWTLLWDRLPMAIAFAGLLAALVGEHLGARIGRSLLPPALLFCVGSVLYWYFAGDLRLYVWAQAVTVLAVPLALWLLPARCSHRRYYLYGFVLYGFAKLSELADQAIYQWTGEVLSGHSAKHLLAAAGIACFYVMLAKRQPLPAYS